MGGLRFSSFRVSVRWWERSFEQCFWFDVGGMGCMYDVHDVTLSLSLCRRLSLLARGAMASQALVTALLCGIFGLALVDGEALERGASHG